MVWVDNPIGTGFSPAAPGATGKIHSEAEIARQFMGFCQNFMNTFGLKGRKVYITGESYAGMYIPYIAAAMLDANNTDLYNVAGIQLIDPVIDFFDVQAEAPAVMALDHFSSLFSLNDTFMAAMHETADVCGYTEWMNIALTFPPKGPIPPLTPVYERPNCEVWLQIAMAAVRVNPCFNCYHITNYCPYLSDQLGFSLGWGPNNYFNRTDVQQAINAPPTNYRLCGDPGLFSNGDASMPSALGPLPSVIERVNNVIITHGMLDFILLANGTLASLQNMTWNGKQGFQTAPSSTLNFFVPYHQSIDDIISVLKLQLAPKTYSAYDVAGAGLLGVTHHERVLTWVTVNTAGHEMPQYTPGAAYRQLELLLGRIASLEQRRNFTTQTGDYGD